jgi:hypothetical protein
MGKQKKPDDVKMSGDGYGTAFFMAMSQEILKRYSLTFLSTESGKPTPSFNPIVRRTLPDRGAPPSEAIDSPEPKAGPASETHGKNRRRRSKKQRE